MGDAPVPPYAARETELYIETKGKRTDIQKNLESVKVRLLENPKQAAHSKRMVGPSKGLREAHITGNWRVIFTICEECRELGEQDTNKPKCLDCGDQPNETVNFLFVMDPHGT